MEDKKQIKTLNVLRILATKKIVKVRIIISSIGGYGKLDIGKKISFAGGKWRVASEGKEDWVEYDETGLLNDTCIVEAIKKMGLFLE